MWLLQGATKRASVDPPQTEGFLLSSSVIDRSTIQAYRETDYHVHGDTPMTLKVGKASPALASLHKASRVTTSAFITAFNPFSQAFDQAANVQRQAALAHLLKSRGLTFIDGIGQHPTNKEWPGEASFLVLYLSLEAAKVLGVQHEQNAIIWNGPDAVPQLILLK
jgi:hypothetical protein